MTAGGLRIRLVGRFALEGFDGHASVTVPNGRAQRLLAVLAAHQGRFVPTDTIIGALWPDAAPGQAGRPGRNLAALVSRLRRSIGRDRVEGDPTGYRLVRDATTTVDVYEGLALAEEAERDLDRGLMLRALSGAQSAEELLGRGTALVGEPDAPWAQEVRRLVATTLSRARSCHWTAALALGEDRTAIDLASRALAADALDEPAARALMRAYIRQGADGAALAAYEQLRRALSEELGADPSPATQEIYRSLLLPDDRTPAAAPVAVRGRDRELAQLRRAWSAATRGHGGLVLVTGEAGIGKSALVRVLAGEARDAGATVLEVRCQEAERSLYLQPLAEAVRTLVGRQAAGSRVLHPVEREALADLAPELAPDTADPRPATDELRHRRTLLALAELVGRTAEVHPILLVVEDLHHASQTTVEALHVLATRLAARRVLVLATERSAEERSGTESLLDVATHLRVRPLPRATVTALLAASGAGYDPDTFFAWTGGSPLLVGELLRHPAPAPADGPVIPEDLYALLRRRLDATAEDVALLLGQAAVLGSSFSLDDAAALAGVGPEECARRAERAVRAGLLVSDGERYRFANDIVRTVAYSRAELPVRISRHRRAAELLADRPEAAAGHHSAAGDHAAAAQAWLAAADAAHLVFAHRDAERLLTSALESAERTGDAVLRTTVLLRRGQARCDLARFDGPDGAHADHDAALALARALGDEELEARALEALGWTALWARDAFAAVELAEQAGHLAESAAAAPGARRSSLLLLGRVRHWDGDYSGATHAYQQVLAVGTEDALGAVAMAYRGALLQHMDRFAEARAVLERAVGLCRRTGEFRSLLQSLFFCGLARGDAGDFAGALRALDRARRLIDDAGVGYYRAGIETTTSWLWQELGDLERAREHAETAVDLAHRGGGALELEQELHALLARADCLLLAGKDDDAGATVEEAAPLLRRSLPFRPRAAMRLLEMQARWEPERAEELLATARTYRSAKYEALALTHLGRPQEAASAALRTRSDLVVAQVGAPSARGPARDRIAAALPAELRPRFVEHGRLVVPHTVR
ncbi:AAA family ATPase [Actinomycetospora lutea]|uniref:ATP-binding protein n=1 Tax=Actinomycetospora lutea TaxID=663604 RepID=UPI002366ED32|nr:AAA family ATPase [Actinomycetospora lutea]MDD7938276.1 AAA family ATPase [Actinomycetospora lutea]